VRKKKIVRRKKR